MKKIGFWTFTSLGPSLENELRNGWDIVVAESDSRVKFPFVDGCYIHFKDIDDRLKLPELFRQKGISHQGWEIHGPMGFHVSCEPRRVILEKLKKAFPGAVLYEAATHQEIDTEE